MITWGKIWKESSSKDVKFVRVLEEKKTNNSGQVDVVKVANAYNGNIWLRRVLGPDTLPGLYEMQMEGNIIMSREMARAFYPDLSLKMGYLHDLRAYVKLESDLLQRVAAFCEASMEMGFNTVTITADGIYTKSTSEKPTPKCEDKRFAKFPFTCSVDTFNLSMAINEAAEYPGRLPVIAVSANGGPLVIGVSHVSCAVVTHNYYPRL